jgi:predicted secreted protein
MPSGVLAKGTVIERSPSGTATYATIENVGSITGPNSTADTLDVSNQDSSSLTRQWISGLVNPGSVSFSCNYDPTDATGAAHHNQILADASAGTALDWRITFRGGVDSMTFPGTVTKAEVSAPIDGALMLDVEITITGAITWPT